MAYVAGVQAYGSDDDTKENDGGQDAQDPAVPSYIPLVGLGLDTTRQWLTGLKATPRGADSPSIMLDDAYVPTVDNLIAGSNITLTKSGADVTIASTGGGGGSLPGTTKGDMLVYDGSDYQRLAVGTNGYVLAADSAEALGVKWQAGGEASSPLTTKGDIYTRSDSADARLPVGDDGDVLTADSSAANGVKWAPASGGGGGGAIGTTIIVAHGSSNNYNYAAIGNFLSPDIDLDVKSIQVRMTTVAGAVYKIGIVPVNSSTKAMLDNPTYCSTVSVPVIGASQPMYGEFATPFTMTGGSTYIMFYVRTDSTATVTQRMNYSSGVTGWGISIPNSNTCHYMASTNPLSSDVWAYAGSSAWSISFAYFI